jgi:hypothetical protein
LQPQFTKDGSLAQPRDWETWVMVGSSTGLSYATPGAAPVAGAAPGMFHNVYMQPWAYREFIKTWAFFGFGDTASIGAKLPGTASCYACHATEAAHDNVFTQFYPFMRERLAKH